MVNSKVNNQSNTKGVRIYCISYHKGITLISLVITIIILLILAGVTISITMGENGLFNTTKKASEETKKQAAIETIYVKIVNMQTVKYAEKQRMPTLQELADNLYEDKEIEYISLSQKTSLSKQTGPIIKEKIVVGESTKIYTKLKQYPYEIEINSSLEIQSVDGEKVSNTDKAPTIGNVEGEIPEGYIKPSGTKEITTKSDKIDVSNYQYVDTTGLYTKDEVQSGESVYWHKTTIQFPTDGSDTVTVNLGYIPSFMYASGDSDIAKYVWFSEDGCKTFDRINYRSGIFSHGDSGWRVDGNALVFTVKNPSAWSGRNVVIYSIR